MKSDNLVSPHADPWSPDVVDLASLNAEATEVIEQSLRDLRARARSRQPAATPPALVAVGPAGVGKTHLFGRLRRQLGPHAVLVHVRPLLGGEMTPRFLLGQIVLQLGYDSGYETHGLRQIDVMAGVALAVATGQNGNFPVACLQELRELPEAERQLQIEQAVEVLLDRHQDLDSGYLEKLFAVPFAPPLVRQANLVWLGGRELNGAQAARAGVHEALPDSAILPALRTIAVVSAMAAPLLVVFDQLENLVDLDGGGGRVAAYGNLVAELVDQVRDLVIVQMGLSSEWDQHILPRLSTAHRSRAVGRRLNLALPRPEQSRALLELWAARIPKPDGPSPWPFTESQIKTVCDAPGTTPRMLLLELRRVLEGELPLAVLAAAPPAAASEAPAAVAEAAERALRLLDDAIAGEWESRLRTARAHLDEMAKTGHGAEPAYLIDGFIALTKLVTTVGDARVEKGEVVRLSRKTGDLAVCLVHHANNASVRSAFKRLSLLGGNVLGLRERWREWPPTWKTTREQWEALRRSPGIRWHWLDREAAARLLALADLSRDARSRDLNGPDGRPLDLADVEAWARRTLDAGSWDVTRALLGQLEDEAALPSPAPAPPGPPAPTTVPRATGAPAVLQRLRVASLDRLVRELSRNGKTASRPAVVAELRAERAALWIGETIVCWTGP